jgi:hypothetical protein
MVLRCDLPAIPRRRVVRFDQSGTRELLIIISFQRNRRKRVYVEVQWRSEADRKLRCSYRYYIVELTAFRGPVR